MVNLKNVKKGKLGERAPMTESQYDEWNKELNRNEQIKTFLYEKDKINKEYLKGNITLKQKNKKIKEIDEEIFD